MRHVPVVTTSDRPSHPSQAPALVSSAPPPPSSMAAAPATAPRSAAAAVQRRRCRRCRRRCRRRPHSKRDSAEPSEPSGGPLSWHFRRSNFLRTARRPTSIDSLLRPPCTCIYIYKTYIRQVKPIDRLSRKLTVGFSYGACHVMPHDWQCQSLGDCHADGWSMPLLSPASLATRWGATSSGRLYCVPRPPAFKRRRDVETSGFLRPHRDKPHRDKRTSVGGCCFKITQNDLRSRTSRKNKYLHRVGGRLVDLV